MTTGEKLVELSGLLSGSAMEHLESISQGGGTEYILVETIVSADVQEDSFICDLQDEVDVNCDVSEIILRCELTDSDLEGNTNEITLNTEISC